MDEDRKSFANKAKSSQGIFLTGCNNRFLRYRSLHPFFAFDR